jgi:hypothetical protein
MADQSPTISRGTWLLEHVLALLTLGSCFYFYWLVTTIDLAGPIDPALLPPRIVLAGTLSVIAAIVFWIRMYRDYFRQRPATRAVFWGLFLLIGAHLAALSYFVLIWRPRTTERTV